jgi:predicted nucleotidyltransferase
VAVRLAVPRQIAAVLTRLLATDVEVWLIGSRADGTAKASSDWDFVVFGRPEVLDRLRREPAVPSMDILVVIDAHTYVSPWPRLEDAQPKRGTWSQWKWHKLTEEEATYESAKWPDDEDYPDIATKRAFRVRSCESTA